MTKAKTAAAIRPEFILGEGTMMKNADGTPKDWMIVSVTGGDKYAGSVVEVEMFGGKFVQIDVPSERAANNRVTYKTVFYPYTSIFSLATSSKDLCFAFNGLA